VAAVAAAALEVPRAVAARDDVLAASPGPTPSERGACREMLGLFVS